MKKLLIFVFALVATSASAQYYVSVSGGAQMGSAGVVTGTSLNGNPATATIATNEYGSYGEGLNAQLRGGYFFNKTFGIELGLGYLHGADQTIDSYKTNLSATNVQSITERVEGTAYARAYGLSLALIYNFNENIYGKFGAVTKVGGKTEAEFTRTSVTAAGNIVATGIQEYHGRIPLGFIGAMGYKFKLTDKLNLFAELEYLGINVTRDNSEFTKFNMDVPAGLVGAYPGVVKANYTLADLPLSNPVLGFVPREFTYVDSASSAKPTTLVEASNLLSSVAPYSSFGLNIGITYTFGK